jgi:hypothetical protein
MIEGGFQIIENNSDSDTASSVASSNSSRKRGRGRDYDETDEYPSAREAEQQVEKERIWSKNGGLKASKAGKKQFYRCNKVTARAKEQCEAKLYNLYPHLTNNAIICRTSCNLVKKICIRNKI